jgi:hypothetical protein
VQAALPADMDEPADFADRARQIAATEVWLGGDFATPHKPVPQQVGVHAANRLLPASAVPTAVSAADGESEVDQEDSPDRAAAVAAIVTKVRW